MSNCPNCLASNPFKKVYRDGLVFVECEYCNTIFEDTTTRAEREERARLQNEVQNKIQKEQDTAFSKKVVWGLFALIIFAYFVDAILMIR